MDIDVEVDIDSCFACLMEVSKSAKVLSNDVEAVAVFTWIEPANLHSFLLHFQPFSCMVMYLRWPTMEHENTRSQTIRCMPLDLSWNSKAAPSIPPPSQKSGPDRPWVEPCLGLILGRVVV